MTVAPDKVVGDVATAEDVEAIDRLFQQRLRDMIESAKQRGDARVTFNVPVSVAEMFAEAIRRWDDECLDAKLAEIGRLAVKYRDQLERFGGGNQPRVCRNCDCTLDLSVDHSQAALIEQIDCLPMPTRAAIAKEVTLR
jgi:hypothetical protein